MTSTSTCHIRAKGQSKHERGWHQHSLQVCLVKTRHVASAGYLNTTTHPEIVVTDVCASISIKLSVYTDAIILHEKTTEGMAFLSPYV